MKVINTTIQNRTKQSKLNSQHILPTHYITSQSTSSFLKSLPLGVYSKEQILFSIGFQLLPHPKTPTVQHFLKGYEQPIIELDNIPQDEFDLLGAAYQYLNSKRENLESGSYYTGEVIAKDLIADLDFSEGQTIFDPACGSGAFLFQSSAAENQIFGVDSDPLAVMIAKFNYFRKFPKALVPNLYNEDFFTWYSKNSDCKFDYVIGNPPFGANLDMSRIPSLHITSGESFSYFLEFGVNLLKDSGVLRFIVPESLLNVKRHSDARSFLLNHTNLRRIKKYEKRFTGVMSDIYLIEIGNKKSSHVIFDAKTSARIPKNLYWDFVNHIFVHLTKADVSLISKVKALKKYDLGNSIFGLGVVTGDNKTKLQKTKQKGFEAIYTGKEVKKYSLSPPNNFLKFDRTTLQQVAPDEIYRAPMKLVYKTICQRLRFALDQSSSLTSNSANILIPNVPGYGILSVLAFLNSDLYSFLHLKLSGGVKKVGKENLQSLPFPKLSIEQNKNIERLCLEAIKSKCDEDLQLYIHFEIFGLSESELNYIRSQLGQDRSDLEPDEFDLAG